MTQPANCVSEDRGKHINIYTHKGYYRFEPFPYFQTNPFKMFPSREETHHKIITVSIPFGWKFSHDDICGVVLKNNYATTMNTRQAYNMSSLNLNGFRLVEEITHAV